MTDVSPKICGKCGQPVESNSEPVTIGGWYSGHEYRWSEGKLILLAVRCPECRATEIEREMQEAE